MQWSVLQAGHQTHLAAGFLQGGTLGFALVCVTRGSPLRTGCWCPVIAGSTDTAVGQVHNCPGCCLPPFALPGLTGLRALCVRGCTCWLSFPALENSARPLCGSERWQKSMGIFQEGLRRRVAECISVPLNCPHATKHPHALPHKSNVCYRGSQGDPHRQRQRRVERPDQSSFAHTIQCLCQNRVAVPAVRAYVIAGVFTDPNPRWRRLADPGSC